MCAVRVIDVNMGVFEMNDRIADEVRARNKANGTFMVNLMASPGAGKTTTLLRTIADLRDEYKIGVMEADIDASVDAEKMIEAGVRSIQIHTGGECAMDASMTQQALEEFDTSDLDLLFMENVGNLVCTAEQDTGVFTVCQAVIVNKVDTRKFFRFDDEAFIERVHSLNPDAKIFFLSSKTGEGFDAWTGWLREQIGAYKAE